MQSKANSRRAKTRKDSEAKRSDAKQSKDAQSKAKTRKAKQSKAKQRKAKQSLIIQPKMFSQKTFRELFKIHQKSNKNTQGIKKTSKITFLHLGHLSCIIPKIPHMSKHQKIAKWSPKWCPKEAPKIKKSCQKVPKVHIFFYYF